MTFDMTVDTVINAWKRKTCPGTRKSSVMEYLTDAELFFVLCPYMSHFLHTYFVTLLPQAILMMYDEIERSNINDKIAWGPQA